MSVLSISPDVLRLWVSDQALRLQFAREGIAVIEYRIAHVFDELECSTCQGAGANWNTSMSGFTRCEECMGEGTIPHGAMSFQARKDRLVVLQAELDSFRIAESEARARLALLQKIASDKGIDIVSDG